MSTRTPSSLQRHAMQSLLSSQSLAISALEDLPLLLFPSVFMEAYAGGHTEVLKAMVQAWPFPCLPLGDLEESPDPQTFKAVLDGLDLLLAKKEHPSRWKLQVLDLRKEHPGIWIQGYPSMATISYPDILTDKPTVSCCSGMCEQQPLVVVTDLTLKQDTHGTLQGYLLQWAGERRERVQLCTRKLKLLSDSCSEIQKVLHMVRLDSIQELVVCELWDPDTMKQCAPYLSLMKNLHILNISNRREYICAFPSRVRSYSWKLKARFWHLQHVQELHMEAMVFVPGNLPAIIRSLPPLKTLSLDGCLLVETEMWFLSQCPHTRQLKRLLLRRLPMNVLSPEPLRVLLELVAGTLKVLVLDLCDMTDAKLYAILPALSQCSQLCFFSFYGNRISLAALQDLLSLTAGMGHLRWGLYPAPLESYKDQDPEDSDSDDSNSEDNDPEDINPERLAEVLAGLARALREMRTTQKIQIGGDYCPETKKYQFYSLEPDGSWVVTKKELPGLSDLPV